MPNILFLLRQNKYDICLINELFVHYNYYCLVVIMVIIAAERQRGSTLFLTLHEVLAFSCPVSGGVIYCQNLDFCGGDPGEN